MNLQKFVSKALAFEESLTQILLGFIVVLVFIAAITRYLGIPINWSVDVAQAIFVWVIYVGANQAWRNSRHMGVEVLFNIFPSRIQTVIQLLLYLVISVFLLSMIIGGVHISIVNVGRILEDIPISYSFVTMAVPIGAFLMLLTTWSKIVTLLKKGAKENSQPKELKRGSRCS